MRLGRARRGAADGGRPRDRADDTSDSDGAEHGRGDDGFSTDGHWLLLCSHDPELFGNVFSLGLPLRSALWCE